MTRRRHLSKTQQAVSAVLEEVAPKQSEKLWYSLVPSLTQKVSTDSESEDRDVDNVLMNALTECYSNASSWDTRRQILSIMADQVSFQTLKKWIPDLTRYRLQYSTQYCKKAYNASRESCSTTTSIPHKIVRVTHTGRPLLGFHCQSSRYPGFAIR